jgi:hypothetical protein
MLNYDYHSFFSANRKKTIIENEKYEIFLSRMCTLSGFVYVERLGTVVGMGIFLRSGTILSVFELPF